MKITKAIKLAGKQKRGITRRSWGVNPMWIIPTNTVVCMIAMRGETKLASRWNPNATDLVADDWIPYG